MTDSPRSDDILQATTDLIAAFQITGPGRGDAILQAYLTHQRATANALNGSLDALARIFERETRKAMDHSDLRFNRLDSEIADSIAANKEMMRRVHTVGNQMTYFVDTLHQQEELAELREEQHQEQHRQEGEAGADRFAAIEARIAVIERHIGIIRE